MQTSGNTRLIAEQSLTQTIAWLALFWICSASPVLSTNAEIRDGTSRDPPSPRFNTFGPSKTFGGWQLPDGTTKKVLVIFSGFNTVPHHFWDRSRACPSCKGFPEHRKIVIDAIARNYAVFIPQSIDPDKTWEGSPVDSPNMKNILVVLYEWRRALGLENVPNVGLGISTGGLAVSTLGLIPGLFESIAMMMYEGTEEVFDAASPVYPPTIFVHMPKDSITAKQISNRTIGLDLKGVPNRELKWYEHAVTPDWFAQSIPGVDLGLSGAIYDGLRADGWLQYGTDKLLSNWYKKDWKRFWNKLAQDPVFEDRQLFQDCVKEELNVAYALHATLARVDNEMFGWFEGCHQVCKKRSTS